MADEQAPKPDTKTEAKRKAADQDQADAERMDDEAAQAEKTAKREAAKAAPVQMETRDPVLTVWVDGGTTNPMGTK